MDRYRASARRKSRRTFLAAILLPMDVVNTLHPCQRQAALDTSIHGIDLPARGIDLPLVKYPGDFKWRWSTVPTDSCYSGRVCLRTRRLCRRQARPAVENAAWNQCFRGG